MMIQLLAKELGPACARKKRFDLTDREAKILASELAERRCYLEVRSQDEMREEIYQGLKRGQFCMFGVPVAVAA